ncbi:MAG: NAD-binding oxidoreductase [Myxococcaceae bacterium]|nr:NAD-binding oxidoreductase [Myxococcaceae bacterium]
MRSWHSAQLVQRRVVDEGLVEVSLAVPGAVATSFARPGQFHRIRQAGSGESMFAIASPPGSTTFDYLIRRGTGVSEALATLAEGSALEVTPPEGPGFPIDEARGRDVLFVCTGTALAPCRSALGLIAQRREDFGRVTLVQGQRSPRQLPWLDELRALPRVDVHTVVTDGGAGWTGPVGFVQALVPDRVTLQTVAFLVGQKEMTDEVTALLERGGVPRSRVFLNV